MSEEGTAQPVHWLDEYEGQHVVVQLKGVYYSVRSPGTIIPLGPDGKPVDLTKPVSGPIAGYHQMPAIQGSARIKRDEFGNVRLVVQTPDPGGANGFLHVDMEPDAIDLITIFKEKLVIEG